MISHWDYGDFYCNIMPTEGNFTTLLFSFSSKNVQIWFYLFKHTFIEGLVLQYYLKLFYQSWFAFDLKINWYNNDF